MTLLGLDTVVGLILTGPFSETSASAGSDERWLSGLATGGLAKRICEIESADKQTGDDAYRERTRPWLEQLDAETLGEVELFACGPHPMLEAVAALARDFGLPCQVSLEEFMACAVGGCAGCVVQVQTAKGPAMRRVCVDGPVFDAHQVFAAD